MAKVTDFFLGANSGGGFRSLFRQLTENGDTYDLMILKGGPGGGKSTFMAQLGAAMEAAGTDVEYVRCAGDPDSLDAVLLPQLNCAVADGTPPHVLEPVCPAAHRYVDLSRFCQVEAVKSVGTELRRLSAAARNADARAHHALLAAAQMEGEIRMAAERTLDTAKLAKRVNGIIGRELRRRGGERGKTAYRFLGGATCEGYVWRFDSVTALCAKVYEFADSYGLAASALERLRRAAVERGWDTVACLSPESPERIEHLLIPGLDLAFVTSRAGMRYSAVPARRVRIDAMTEPENRPRLRFEGKLVSLLRQEALGALGEAGEARRQMEELCNPYVDFDGVRALAAVETSRLLSWME